MIQKNNTHRAHTEKNDLEKSCEIKGPKSGEAFLRSGRKSNI